MPARHSHTPAARRLLLPVAPHPRPLCVFALFVCQAVKAAERKLEEFLALMPAEDVEAAQSQLAVVFSAQ